MVPFRKGYGEEFPVLEYSDLNHLSLFDEYENLALAAFVLVLAYWRCCMSIVSSDFSCN